MANERRTRLFMSASHGAGSRLNATFMASRVVAERV